MSSIQPTRLPHLATAPAPGKQATSAYEIKNLYKPSSSSGLAASSGRAAFGETLSFPTPPQSDSASPPSSPETDAHPSRQDSPGASSVEEEEEEGDAVPAPLPSFTVRPKGIKERERERALGKKSTSLAASMARKRADENKWAKYANLGSFEICLDLSPEELQRH